MSVYVSLCVSVVREHASKNECYCLTNAHACMYVHTRAPARAHAHERIQLGGHWAPLILVFVMEELSNSIIIPGLKQVVTSQ